MTTTTKPEQLFQTAGRNEEIIFDASTQLWSSEKKFHTRRAACVRKSKRREIMTLSRTVLERMSRD